ncbi:MAG: superoxide dismutase family protein [Hyphomonadaceae bacterium]|nr:superoxide dismutase family protein [Hyphomonadaceae bacterium]
MRLAVALVFASFLGGCSLLSGFFGNRGGGGEPASPAAAQRTTWIVGASGQAIGQATFTQAPQGVLIRLEFTAGALPAGWHGAHLHQVGNCSDFAAGFAAAGPHIGVHADTRHGLLEPAGPEAGDLPNLYATASGTFGAEFIAPRVTLGAASTPRDFGQLAKLPLLDTDGSALVIHAAPDDHMSQPIGGAGARIACAALTPSS